MRDTQMGKRGLFFFVCYTLVTLIKANSQLGLLNPKFPPNVVYESLEQSSFTFGLRCVQMDADELHPKYNHISTFERLGGGIAVTYFPAEEWRLALGDTIEMERLFQAAMAMKSYTRYPAIKAIHPNERDNLTGPFPYHGGSVRSLTFPSNFTYPEHSVNFEEKNSGTYCVASRPLSKEGSPGEPFLELNEPFSFGDNFNYYPKNASYYSPLFFTFGFLMLSTYWIYAMVCQRSKIPPAQHGLLLLIVSSAFGTPFFFWWTKSCNYNYLGFFTPWNLQTIKESFDIFTERLVLFLAAFGFGVWRPIRRNFIFGGTLILLVPFVFRVIIKFLHWKFWVDETALDLINEFLNHSSDSMIWAYAIYLLYQAYTSASSMKSTQTSRLIKHSLVYCVSMITLRPFVLAYFKTIFSWTPTAIEPGVEDFVRWSIRYTTEVLIPCYIWCPSQNERIAYKAEGSTEFN